jgi:hypothetical protein
MRYFAGPTFIEFGMISQCIFLFIRFVKQVLSYWIVRASNERKGEEEVKRFSIDAVFFWLSLCNPQLFGNSSSRFLQLDCLS